MKQTNLPSIISDFRFLDTPSEDIKLLRSSLILSGDVVENNPDSIGPQFLGNKIYVPYFILRIINRARGFGRSAKIKALRTN